MPSTRSLLQRIHEAKTASQSRLAELARSDVNSEILEVVLGRSTNPDVIMGIVTQHMTRGDMVEDVGRNGDVILLRRYALMVRVALDNPHTPLEAWNFLWDQAVLTWSVLYPSRCRIPHSWVGKNVSYVRALGYEPIKPYPPSLMEKIYKDVLQMSLYSWQERQAIFSKMARHRDTPMTMLERLSRWSGVIGEIASETIESRGILGLFEED